MYKSQFFSRWIENRIRSTDQNENDAWTWPSSTATRSFSDRFEFQKRFKITRSMKTPRECRASVLGTRKRFISPAYKTLETKRTRKTCQSQNQINSKRKKTDLRPNTYSVLKTLWATTKVKLGRDSKAVGRYSSTNGWYALTAVHTRRQWKGCRRFTRRRFRALRRTT